MMSPEIICPHCSFTICRLEAGGRASECLLLWRFSVELFLAGRGWMCEWCRQKK